MTPPPKKYALLVDEPFSLKNNMFVKFPVKKKTNNLGYKKDYIQLKKNTFHDEVYHNEDLLIFFRSLSQTETQLLPLKF